VPTVSRVAFLWNPANLSHIPHYADIQAGAKALGVGLISVEVSRLDAFERAFLVTPQLQTSWRLSSAKKRSRGSPCS
jgi:hypothetical protein